MVLGWLIIPPPLESVLILGVDHHVILRILMEVSLIMVNSVTEFLRNTLSANQDVLIAHCLICARSQMLVVEPILTLIALDHVLVNIFTRVGFLAIAVTVEVVMAVHIPLILIVLLIIEEFARLWHASIAAVTPEFKLRIELDNIMSLVAMDHTPNAEAVWLHELA